MDLKNFIGFILADKMFQQNFRPGIGKKQASDSVYRIGYRIGIGNQFYALGGHRLN